MTKVKRQEGGAVMFIDGPLSRKKELECHKKRVEGDGKEKWRQVFRVRTLLTRHVLRVDMRNQLF